MRSHGKKTIVLLLIATISFSILLPHDGPLASPVYNATDTDAVSCSIAVSNEDIRISSRLLELLLGKGSSEDNDILLIPGGMIFGARIKQSYVTVSDPGEIKELKCGDKIISVNGQSVHSGKEIQEIIHSSQGGEIDVVYKRGEKTASTKIQSHSENGEYKIGISLKEGAAGIGTITYIDAKTGLFGGLGHGICDPDTAEPVEMCEGDVCGVILGGVKKGEAGKPGELSGILTDKSCGVIYSNTECGIFGKLDEIPASTTLTPVKMGHKEEVHTGSATILSTVKMGACKKFDIEITEINKNSTGTKSFKIKVTDPTLIAITGGVVRGMSGSPIIQDGKLIGAVTHVMVANPTEGYGIFIDNMLSASQQSIQPKAA